MVYATMAWLDAHWTIKARCAMLRSDIQHRHDRGKHTDTGALEEPGIQTVGLVTAAGLSCLRGGGLRSVGRCGICALSMALLNIIWYRLPALTFGRILLAVHEFG